MKSHVGKHNRPNDIQWIINGKIILKTFNEISLMSGVSRKNIEIIFLPTFLICTIH